jgi:soluble lytic murein transglycosylase
MRIAGGTNKNEVEFLRGLALEKLDRTGDAIDVYLSIEDGRNEYYGWRASKRLAAIRKSLEKADETPNSEIEVSRRTRFIQDGEMPDPDLEAWPWPNIPPPKDKGLKSLVRPHLKKTLGDQLNQFDLPKFQKIELNNLSGTARALIDLGLYDEAAAEAEISVRSSSKNDARKLSDFDDNTAFTLATYYAQGGYADRAIGFVEPKWKKIDRDIPIESIPNDQALLLYPTPYQVLLIDYGRQKNVDPRFILSIMRQESRFRADIKSPAAARGLMQFISNTSNDLAVELGIRGFRQNELYAPETAIRFGSHYMSNIFKDFPDQPQAVAASYNGGEDRMARWLKRANTNDPDQYVPEIVFAQTKDYVYRVMTNYRMYRFLYDANLRPRQATDR